MCKHWFIVDPQQLMCSLINAEYLTASPFEFHNAAKLLLTLKVNLPMLQPKKREFFITMGLG
jgi:hypothetical protein